MLDRIVAAKLQEIALRRQQKSEAVLRREADRWPQPPGLYSALAAPGWHVIAEIKYRSPSRGSFRCRLTPPEIAQGYVEAGADAISILTDEPFFGGSPEHLQQVRRLMLDRPNSGERGAGESVLREVPLLRKDFILDRYQLLEARAWGAAAVLLIVACLDAGPLRDLTAQAADLGMDVLVEVHDLFELERALKVGVALIGVNNRNLRTFEVDIRTSFEVARRLEGESGLLLVAESGLSTRTQLLELADAGYRGFLIGSAFMDTGDPGAALRSLLNPEAVREDQTLPGARLEA
jgi:indole-3-glycerol phosphate synthase